MKKIVLLDGNNLLFRAYYATAYAGNLMKNSKGFPTNAIYGFITMINKIVNEEKPEYLVVAFDIGKNFRFEKYKFYKEGRSATPDELKIQFPIAKELLNCMGIKYLEKENYEADDIIGTIAHMCEKYKNYEALIVSSDKDLLQLITHETHMKLIKSKEAIYYDEHSFKADWGIEPINIIDFKALAGDSSDNIPGVSGIGEKTALKLLSEYKTIEGLYENIDKITGKLKEKLINDKENAFISKEIATIYKEVPLNIDLDELIFEKERNNAELIRLYQELEFYSLIKNQAEVVDKNEQEEKIEYISINNIDELIVDDIAAFYLETDSEDYYNSNIIGLSISDKNKNYYVKKELINDALIKLKDKVLYTYDLKKAIVTLKNKNIVCNDDIFIATYLLSYNVKSDIAYLANQNNSSMLFYTAMRKKKFEGEEIIENIVRKSKFIFDNRDKFIKELKLNDSYLLYREIEMPLVYILANMEISGVNINLHLIDEIKKEIKTKIDDVSEKIYELTGEVFNLASTIKLGQVLFDKLGLPVIKSTKTRYKTDANTLHKLQGKHPVIPYIVTYRNLAKLYNTYLDGFENYVYEDGLIHTIYNQAVTRTGRISSSEPNLQNIPTRDEEGKRVRSAFVPKNDLFISADYSQIELRILAHISNDENLIKAFNENKDIHVKVASDIYGVPESEVTKTMRRTAKAVIFGIVYGIGGYGLGDNLDLSVHDAKMFIEKYYKFYPGVKSYMERIVSEAYRTGCVETLFKRKRIIDEINNKNIMIKRMGERIALNTPIQGTGADIIKKAMVDVDEEFKRKNLKSEIVMQIHDEIIIDTFKEEEEIVKKILKTKMESTVKLSVPLKVEVTSGSSWYEI